MKCCHCKRRIWFWQKAARWFSEYKDGKGNYIWRHEFCRIVYDEGYVLGKERGIKEGREQGGALESLARHMKPVTEAMRKVGLI